MKIYKYNGKCNVAGENIRLLRERAKLSQEKLAARLQPKGLPLNQNAISRIASGDRVVADFELMLLAQVLNVCIYDLLKNTAFEE